MRYVQDDLILPQTSKWLAEMNYALRDTPLPPAPENPPEPPEIPPGPDLDTFTLAKSYFDLKEFDRAAFFARKLTSNLGRFLHLYARFMSAEKKRMDDLTDSVVSPDSAQLSQLRQLRVELQQLHADGQLDAYGLYVYGVVLRKLSLPELATPVLCEAVAGEPGHWGAWLELSCLVTSRDKLASLQLPDHWCKQVKMLETCFLVSNSIPFQVFLAHTYLELQQNEQAVEIYIGLSGAGLVNSTYIMAQVFIGQYSTSTIFNQELKALFSAQVAIAFHNMRQVDQAVTYFKQLGTVDPYRLDILYT